MFPAFSNIARSDIYFKYWYNSIKFTSKLQSTIKRRAVIVKDGKNYLFVCILLFIAYWLIGIVFWR